VRENVTHYNNTASAVSVSGW